MSDRDDITSTLFGPIKTAKHVRTVTYTDGNDTVTVVGQPDSGPVGYLDSVLAALDADDHTGVAVETVDRYTVPTDT